MNTFILNIEISLKNKDVVVYIQKSMNEYRALIEGKLLI